MWLYVPSACSPEVLPDWTSDSESRLAQMFAQSVTWRTKLKPSSFWLRVFRKGQLTTLRSGLMSALSMDRNGAVKSTSSAVVSRAPIYPWPVIEKESLRKPHPVSGLSSHGSFATFDPDGCLWRTSQESLFPTPTTKNLAGFYQRGCGLFLERFPNSGSMRSGLLFERPTWAPPRRETGRSFWPASGAAQMNDGERPESWYARQAALKEKGCNGNGAGVPLAIATKAWATANAPNGGRVMSREDVEAKGATATGKRQVDLESQTRHWSTPQAHDMAPGNRDRVGRYGTEHGGRNLTDEVVKWSAPRSEDAESCGNHPRSEGDSLTGQVRNWATADANTSTRSNGVMGPNLREQTQNWAAPTSTEARQGYQSRPEGMASRQNQESLTTQAIDFSRPDKAHGTSEGTLTEAIPRGLPALTVERFESLRTRMLKHGRKLDETRVGSTLRLNPAFDAWHMGFPWWWTRKEPISFAAWDLRSYLFRQRLRLQNLCGDSK